MRKKLLILGLIMMMVLTACGGSKEKKETEPNEDITENEYFKPLIEEINGDESRGVTAKFNGFNLAFQMILKDGYEIKNVEDARNTVQTLSKEFLEETGKKGYKVEYLDPRNTKKPLLQAIDGEMTIDSFEVMEINEDSVRELAAECFESSEITEAIIDNGVITVKYRREGIFARKTLLKANAAWTADFLEEVFKNKETKEVNLYMQSMVTDGKGNERLEDVIVFKTNKETVSDVNWINMFDILRKDYTALGNLATVYEISDLLTE